MPKPARSMTAFLTSLVLFSPALLSLGGCATPVPVLHPSLNESYYSRCVLRTDGKKMYSANYTGEGGYEPGSTVKITMFSEIRVDLDVNKIPHQMHPVGGKFNARDIEGFVRKYFVRSRDALALDDADEATMSAVNAGRAAIGMTKDQVYMALGPPAEINFGQEAIQLDADTILDANRWIYYTNPVVPFWFQKVYTFSDDELVTVE